MCNNKAFRYTFQTEILRNEQIAEGIYILETRYLEEAIPGQFVNLYLNRQDLLLPRPVSICRLDDKKASFVYRIEGAGTKELSLYSEGDSLRVSTPFGNGFDLSKTQGKSALIVGGGIGIPPLLELTYQLRYMDISVSAVLGYKETPFLAEEFVKAGAVVHVATDSGRYGFKGTVLHLIKGNNINENLSSEDVSCFACGPRPMLKAISQYCMQKDIEVQVSMEERMGCGFGACVGCVCKIRTGMGIEQKRVCRDGPVFDGSEVIWDA